MMRKIFGRRSLVSLVPVALTLFVVAACGSSDEPTATLLATTDNAAVQTEVAETLATQQAFQQQIDDSVAATITAQSADVTSEPEASPAGKGDELAPTATEEALAPTPTATVQPDPTSTPAPPAATATPEPPQPSPTPTEIPPTATPETPAAITFARPDRGHASESGEHLSFAQASASFDVAQFPARTSIRSGVYFGLAENVKSTGTLENSFVAEDTGTLRITADAGWNGLLTTKGWGSMSSSFKITLAIVDRNSQLVVGQISGGQSSIASPAASTTVSGNQTLTLEALVGEGVEYTIQLIATCSSSGSSNVWASDTECAFDGAAGGYVEWRSLAVEYLP